MTARPRVAGLVLSLVLVAVGIVLLLNNLGVLHWAVWRRIIHFWPLVLVLSGAWLFWRHVKGD